MGMHYGDGFLSKRKNEYRLKGNKNEREYYDKFIRRLYKNLFNLNINLKEYKDTYGFEIASRGIWTFKNKILGIPAGRKDNIKLPDVIKVNNKDILSAFIRGLFDTDGCVCFTKRYGNYVNYYPNITLTLKSKDLIFEVAGILEMLGLNPKVSENYTYWRIDLYGYKRLEKYSKIIGWSNPAKINKIKKWKNTYPSLGKEVMMDVV